MFSLKQNCKVVLLADNTNYNGAYTITAIPLKDTTTGAISIDSILINFGSTSYLLNEIGLKVSKFFIYILHGVVIIMRRDTHSRRSAIFFIKKIKNFRKKYFYN